MKHLAQSLTGVSMQYMSLLLLLALQKPTNSNVFDESSKTGLGFHDRMWQLKRSIACLVFEEDTLHIHMIAC